MSETYDDSGDIEYAPTIGGKQCFYCDCLPAGADGKPSDATDAVYTVRVVMLEEDAKALVAQLRDAEAKISELQHLLETRDE